MKKEIFADNQELFCQGICLIGVKQERRVNQEGEIKYGQKKTRRKIYK